MTDVAAEKDANQMENGLNESIKATGYDIINMIIWFN